MVREAWSAASGGGVSGGSGRRRSVLSASDLGLQQADAGGRARGSWSEESASARLEAAVKPADKPAVERAVEDSGTLLGEAKRSAASEAPRKGFLRTFVNLWGWTRTGRSASHDS
jgi:hypothetical protein